MILLVDDKAPLEAVYLAHFGVKGMRWGRRKTNSSGDKNKTKMSTSKKVAIGSAVLGGAAITALVLSKRGTTPVMGIGKVNLKPTTMDRLREIHKMKVDNFNKIKPSLGKIQYFDSAKNAWVAPKSTDLVRRADFPRPRTASKINLGDVNSIRRAWNDPNHVWDL